MITGASGILGRAVHQEFKKYPYEIQAISNSRPNDERISLDLCKPKALDEALNDLHPNVIIHCAAERRPDVAEKDPDGSWHLNVKVPEQLAKWAKENGTWLIYISTDYVFWGDQAPYQVDAVTKPINLYGESKLAGEKAVLGQSADFAVLRVPVLYTTSPEYLSEDPVSLVAENILNKGLGKHDHWSRRFPTNVADVAIVLEKLVRFYYDHHDMSGIWHYSGNERYTKYEMALLMGEILDLDTSEYVPDDQPPQGAPRPYDCKLDPQRLEKYFVLPQSIFKEQMTELLNPYKRGKSC